ncbi:MAG: SMP-30/gluconolactonase/LRE family protein [Pseudomonadota bacterium]
MTIADQIIGHVGHNLSRPECVLATSNGDFFTAHGDRGVARIRPDGTQLALAPPTKAGGVPILANGIALQQDGSFLVSNIADGGGLFILDPDGMRLFHDCRPNGESGTTPPPVNFVYPDQMGRIWITVSSTYSPRSLAYNRQTANGYIGVIENGEFRIVVDGLAYTNELRTDYENGWLYVAETMRQKISRIRLDDKGLHGGPELFAQMPRGAFVDGLEVDSEGAVLAACIISNEIFRITPDGQMSVIAGERMDAWVDEVEQAFDAGHMGRPHLDKSPTQHLRNTASVTFCGEELDTLVCGVLLDDKLPLLKADVKGRPPLHWHVDVPVWGEPF